MIKLTQEKLCLDNMPMGRSRLSLLQRIILGTDGSMTYLLEELTGEELHAHKLHEDIAYSDRDVPQLNLTCGQRLWRRIITLRGRDSAVNYLYAESLIAADNLEQEFADELLNTDTPIGKIWEKFKVETYKTLSHWGEEAAGEVADYFRVAPDTPLLYRTYVIFCNRKPIMLITEKFPSHWFQCDAPIRHAGNTRWALYSTGENR